MCLSLFFSLTMLLSGTGRQCSILAEINLSYQPPSVTLDLRCDLLMRRWTPLWRRSVAALWECSPRCWWWR